MESTPYREVTTLEELRAIIGPVMQRAAAKDRAALHPVQAQWIAASPFCLIATCNANGECDVSPKGDPAGFTLVLDPHTLAIPERPGNRRADGFLNILSNPHVGLLYLIPGRNETLRINGRARIVSDAPFFDRMIVNEHRPKLALVVDIEQIFFHCAKAFMRSHLWVPSAWTPDGGLPSAAEISCVLQGGELEELQRYYGPTYAQRLYRDGGPAADPPVTHSPLSKDPPRDP